jgi:hypothetical protein
VKKCQEQQKKIKREKKALTFNVNVANERAQVESLMEGDKLIITKYRSASLLRLFNLNFMAFSSYNLIKSARLSLHS